MSIEADPTGQPEYLSIDDRLLLEDMDPTEVSHLLKIIKEETPELADSFNTLANRLTDDPRVKAGVIAGLVAITGVTIYKLFSKEIDGIENES